jgi:hypothetical protein
MTKMRLQLWLRPISYHGAQNALTNILAASGALPHTSLVERAVPIAGN